MKVLMRVLLFAAQKHAGQTRDGGKGIPYINHPIEVGLEVANAGGAPAATCKGLLHDTQEECDVTDEEILALFPGDAEFGGRVLAGVKLLTDPPGMPYAQIKERETQMMRDGSYGPDERLVKIADQLCNMRDLVRHPPGWPLEEVRTYIVQMKTLVDAGRGTSPMLESAFDEAYLAAQSFYGMTE